MAGSPVLNLFPHEPPVRASEASQPDAGAISDSARTDPERLKQILRTSRLEREQQLAGSSGAGKETVRYGARDSLLIDVKSHRVFLRGGGTISYGTMRLEADSVVLDQDRRVVFADGSPVLWDGKDKISGEQMVYNLDNRRGVIAGGETEFEQGYYHGRRIKKVAPEVLNVEQGSFTTCNLDHPHFRFTSRQMKMYIGDKVVARPVVLYIHDIPVFALPFMARSIRKGRYSGLMVPRYANDSVQGRSIENLSYYKVINDYSDFLGGLDFRENRGLTLRSELNYALKYRLQGEFAGSYLKDSSTGDIRYEARGYHQQNVDPNTSLTVQGNFVSDKNYRADTDPLDYYNRLNRELASSMALTRRFTSSTARINLDRRQFLDKDRITATFPTVSYSMTRRQLFPAEADAGAGGRWRRVEPGRAASKWYNNIYYSVSTNYVRKLSASTVTQTEPDTAVVRLRATDQSSRTNFSLSSNQKILSAYNFSTNFNYSQTWDKSDRGDAGDGWAGDYSVSTGLNTTLYGLFNTELGPLRALRHVVNPSVSLSYVPDYYFKLDPLKLQAERRDKPGAVGGNSVNFNLGNRIQAKTVRGDREKKLDLAQLNFATSYRFDKQEAETVRLSSSLRSAVGRLLDLAVTANHEYGKGKTGLLPVLADLRKARPVNLDFKTSLRLSGKGGAARGEGESEAGLGAPPPEFDYSASNPRGGGLHGDLGRLEPGPWKLNCSFNYRKRTGGAEDTFTIAPSSSFSLTRDWQIQLGGYYDLKEKEFINKSFAVVRDLHCWEASLTWDDYGGQSKYYFYIRIKDLPDIKLEQRGYGR